MSKRRKWTMRMCAHILWLFSLMFGLSYFAIDAVGIRTAYATSQPNEHTPTDITRTGTARPASQSRLTSTVVLGNKMGHPATRSRHLPTAVPTRAIHPTSQHKRSHPHGVRDTKSHAKPRVNHAPHTTINVTDCSVFGNSPPVANTLAAALATATGGDTINFLCAADSTINVSTINISSNLTLNGQSDHTITLSGNDSVQVFSVSNNATLTLNHLTIAHGEVSYYGGGIRIGTGSTVNSSYDIFSSNADQEGGGAVYNSGTFNSTNDTFIGNTSPYGGAIYNNAGTITITGDTFGNGTTGNSATHNGGAIDNENGTISIPANDPSTTFTGNQASTDGGAIYNYNSNIAIPSSLLTSSVTFSNNQSISGDGGAIYNTGTPSNISSTGDTFTGNHADNDEGGGALYNDSGSVTITGDTFGISAHPNSATGGDGGAIYNNGIIAINNAPPTTFDSNHANVGGAIYNSSSATPFSLSTNSVTFTNNSATNGSGGAIYNTGATSAINSTSDTFTSNSAAGGVPPISDSKGGAIYNTAGTVTSSHDTFTSNTAGNGGAVFNNSSGTYSSTTDTFTSNTAAGGVPPIGSSGGAIDNSGGTVTSTTDTFTSNTANNGGAIINYSGTLTLNGGSFGASGFPNSATANGGAIYNAGGTITNPANTVTFTSNTAANGGAIYNTTALAPGPGIVPATSRAVLRAHKNMIPLPNPATITLAGGTFTSNTATVSGGAIASMGGTITLTGGGTLTSNTATVSGGAIYNNGSTINSTSDTFTSNTATGDGGAIYNLGRGTFNSTTDIFTSDTATNGGAVFNIGSTFTLAGGTFGTNSSTKNSASANGGAIYNAGGTLTSTVDTVKFNNNTAVNGGAIFNTTGIPSTINSLHRTRGIVPHSKRLAATGTITFAGGAFTGNSATTNGGAIYNASGSSTTNDVSFDTNSATQDGGAIYNAGVVSSTTDTFHNNSATVNGGAIYNSTTIAPLVQRRNSGPVSSPGTITLSGDTFGDKDKGNSATVNGGAVYNAGGTVTGTAGNTNFISNSAVSGGAIYSSGGTSNFANATFDSNSASVSGGAITNNGSFVNVAGSTFVNNSAVDGGAFYVTDSTAHGTVKNSTFTANSVTVNTTVAGGGAIEVNQGLLDLVSDTIAGNFITAQNWRGYTRGAGLYNRGGTISVLSGILAQNVVKYVSNRPQQYTNNCVGPISDKGFNIESGTECEFTKNPNNTSTPDQQNVTANQLKLGALASNGGPTQTMALGNGSVAINRGANVNDNNCVSTDQRGNARVQQCDVGAFEFGAPVLNKVPGDITIDIATNPTIPGSTTSTTATWTDPTGTLPDSSDAATVTCTPAAGSVFYIGTTTVTCTAKDAANPATVTSQTFKVIVKNSNNTPTLTVPDTIRMQATSSAGANVTYSVTATDGSYPDSQLTLSCKNHANSDPLPSGANANHDFALGWTLIDCTVTNPAGKTDSKAFYVVVIDYPTVNVPKTITVPATSAQGNTVNFTVSAKDPVFAADQLTITCAPDSGSTFPIGTTTVNCRANNPNNYNNSATFNIVVQDIPTVSTPDWDNQTLVVDATSKDGASVDLSKFITANNQYLQSAPAISCWLDSDTNKTNIYPPALGPAIRFRSHNGFVLPVFPITLDGNGTKVDCQATNQPGFTSSVVSFFVKVHDTLAPALNVSDSMTVNATTPKGAVVNYSVMASDPVYPSSALTVSCWNDADNNTLYPTGFSVSATFPIGTTQVDCRVSNPSGGSNTSNFTVVVVNKLQPTLQLPSTITADATSVQGAVVSYDVSATDPIYSADKLNISCTPESGSTFPVGITTVHCNVANPLGTTVYGTFKVIVESNQHPTLHLPSTITVDATNANGAVVTYNVSASDPVYSADKLNISCSPASGATFPIGTTTVHCTATNPDSAIATGTFDVVVQNHLQLMLSLPSTITAGATSNDGAVVTYSVSASDPVYSADRLTISCSPASGSTFPIGTTTVHCTATNPVNTTATGTFNVVVSKLQPTLTVPSMITLNATSPRGAVVNYNVTFSDPIFTANRLTVSCSPASGSAFPIGITTVNCSVTNPLNVTASGTFIVRIRDVGDQIADVMRDLDKYHFQSGIRTQLYNQLSKALSAFNSNRSDTARIIHLLDDFISLVQRLRNHGVSPSQADQLIAIARNIKTVLGG